MVVHNTKEHQIGNLTVDSVYVTGYARIFCCTNTDAITKVLDEYNTRVSALRELGLTVITPKNLTLNSVCTLLEGGYTFEQARKESQEFIKRNWMDITIAVTPNNLTSELYDFNEVRMLLSYGIHAMDLDIVKEGGINFKGLNYECKQGVTDSSILFSAKLDGLLCTTISPLLYGDYRTVKKENINYVEDINAIHPYKGVHDEIFITVRLCNNKSYLTNFLDTDFNSCINSSLIKDMITKYCKTYYPDGITFLEDITLTLAPDLK